MFTIEQIRRLNDPNYQPITTYEEHQDYLALVLKDVAVDLREYLIHPICIPDVLTILEHLLNFDILEVNERAKEHIMESL